MGKALTDKVLDGALDVISAGTIMNVCSAEPTNRTEATSTYSLADEVLTSGDFTKANGDTSGRKVTVAAQNGVTVDATGTATHIAISDGTDLLGVTTVTSQGVTSGNTINVAAFKVEIADPS